LNSVKRVTKQVFIEPPSGWLFSVYGGITMAKVIIALVVYWLLAEYAWPKIVAFFALFLG
jgi:hypothetical protein